MPFDGGDFCSAVRLSPSGSESLDRTPLALEREIATSSDPDGTALTAELVTNVSSGTLNFFPTGFFFYDPGNNNPGTVTFTYRASDGVLTSPATTVTIHLNTAPNGVADFYSIDEDITLAISAATGVL